MNRRLMDRALAVNPANVATMELMTLVDAPFLQACQDPGLAATGYTELVFDAIMPYLLGTVDNPGETMQAPHKL